MEKRCRGSIEGLEAAMAGTDGFLEGAGPGEGPDTPARLDGAEAPEQEAPPVNPGEEAPPWGTPPAWAAPPYAGTPPAWAAPPHAAGPPSWGAPPWTAPPHAAAPPAWAPPPPPGTAWGVGGGWGPPPALAVVPPSSQAPVVEASGGSSWLRLVLAAMLVVVAIGAGVGIGHLVWPSSSTSAATEPSQTVPGGLGAGTLPSSGGSFFGQIPFGSGGSFIGQIPFGSGGSSAGTEGRGGPSNVAAIAAKVDPALVDINSTFSYQAAAGSGTGIVLTSSGEVLTNNHVIDGATRISVTDVGNGKTYSATVVGYDSTHDIAVIQLEGASGLATAKFGNSSTLSVGEPVVAIGNAGGVGGTPTAAGGSITALGQAITASDSLDGTSEHLKGLIQVNADVQPGDSGGSLVTSSGEVIGMDTAGSQNFTFQSSSTSGFAIPINQVLATAKAVEAGHGSSIIHVGATAFLGVLVSTAQETTGSNTQGATVAGVVSGAAAAKAGLSPGDVITSFDGKAVTSPTALSKLLIPLHPGARVPITWVGTSGASQSATVILGSGPPA